MKTNVTLILFFIIISFSSCIKDIVPHVEKYDELLVVEGAITDQPGPYTVKLSKSGDLLELSKYKPYSLCKVEIMDNIGNAETLTEVSEGNYKTDSLGIQGVVGRTYKIKIYTPDGQLYESEEEELRIGSGIDSLYAKVEYKNNPNPYLFRREGLQFYIDVGNMSVGSSYYLWLLESTYKFKVELYDLPELETCYRTQVINELYILNTAEQNQHQGLRTLLNYEDNYTKALTIRYSLKVNQYTLSEKAYKYWHILRKMNANQGSLFTQQPYQVRGNLVNINNAQEVVLGYFMVAGMNEKRIFVDRPPIVFRYSICVKDTGPKPAKPAPECIDCRLTGYLKKPNFWVE
jgi:hypothetical protein